MVFLNILDAMMMVEVINTLLIGAISEEEFLFLVKGCPMVIPEA